MGLTDIILNMKSGIDGELSNREMKTVALLGAAERKLKTPLDACPFPEHTHAGIAWRAGWIVQDCQGREL